MVTWKNRLKIETLKALTIVKTHFKDFSYSEIFSQISKEKVLLEQVHKYNKYSGESGKVFTEQGLHFIFIWIF
jgi:hypothetical protein